MKKKDLLITDIGRFFLFSTLFKFESSKGYVVSKKTFTRYPKFEEVNSIIDKFIGQKATDFENVLCLVDNNEHFHEVTNYECSKRNTILWQRNLTELERELDLEGICFLDFNHNSIIKVDSNEIIEREIDFFELEIFRDNLKLIKEVGFTVEDLINYFTSTIPLPQHVVDYQKSFILSFIIGTIFAASFNFSSTKYLIVNSEWFKSGFLDKSGFIYGFNKFQKINSYSFDETGIWELLLNEGKDDFKELQFMNRSTFWPEFTVVPNYEGGKKTTVYNENNEEYKKLVLIDDLQIFVGKNGKSYLDNYPRELFNNLLINCDAIDMRQIKNLNYFKSWYQFYKYNSFDYKVLNYFDKFNHIIEVPNEFDERLKSSHDKDLYFHDFSHLSGKILQSNLNVIKGQRVNVSDVLLEKDYIGGTFQKRIRSVVDGIISEIDLEKKWIIVKSDKKISNLLNFDYKFIQKFGKDKVKIQVKGLRMECAYISNTKKLSRIINYQSFLEKEKNYSVYLEDAALIDSVMEHFTEKTPTAIIIPSISYEHFVSLLNKYNKYWDMVNIIVVNGFGQKDFSEKQLKFLSLNSLKYLFIDPSENSLYFLDNKEKFAMSTGPYVFEKYVRIYTFDDWNLKGEVIYNDQDSTVIRTDTFAVVDIADNNIIKFNYHE